MMTTTLFGGEVIYFLYKKREMDIKKFYFILFKLYLLPKSCYFIYDITDKHNVDIM